MNPLRQIFAVTAINFKSLPDRFWSSLVIVVGMACVVGVLLSMLSLSAGMFSAFVKAGAPDRVLMTTRGTANEGGSSLTRAQAAIIMDAPGIAKDTDGRPFASPEMMANIPLRKKDGVASNALLRGFGPKSIALRPEIKIVEGRAFQPGKREVIVGVGVQNLYDGLNIGDTITMPEGDWAVVGVFSTNGGQLEAAILADVELVMSTLRRTNFNSVLTKLDTKPNSFAAISQALNTNPQLTLTVERHSTYYERVQNQPQLVIINVISYAVGVIMAVGALFGALNTMYSAVSTRAREIATLRAIGFGAFPVAFSVVAEAVFLALVGAMIGAGIAWFLYDGVQDSFGVNVYHMSVPPSLIASGLIWAVVIALVGGLFPAIRAARLPIATALRAT